MTSSLGTTRRPGARTSTDGRGGPTLRPRGGRLELTLRMLGALALVAVGSIHLEQYFAVYIRVVPYIGLLFLANFAGAVALALALAAPTGRLVDRVLGRGGDVVLAFLALSGIALALIAVAFLLWAEYMPLFGFREHGYRAAILAAFAAEGAATLLLAGLLARLAGRGRHNP